MECTSFFTLTGGSWGAQIGSEDADLVMLFMNHEGADEQAFYENSNAGFREVLTGNVKTPRGARPFLASVRRDFHEASASQ
jgi:lipid-binding SYLF domain-containing protein